ncbi:MAG TPA: acyl-CoA dehydrogenase family protein [Chloroflexota bacterium]|nr:acyl-CoA dehydrogenase family protein [Chloroflexota bacterium]
MATTLAPRTVLSDELIDRCGERAAAYDRENRFFAEDFEELRQAGYLLAAVPEEFGGLGLSLAEVCREQRRLAYRAPATALATNMHLYWTGLVADLHRRGDRSLDWLLEEAAAGEVFAAGHAETGNDLPALLSTTQAERVEGGYKLSGRKMFGSLTPVWTRLGAHAMDTSDPAGPKTVHVFMPRDSAGYEIRETWDTLGMRATRSDDTILNEVFVPDRYVARVLPAGTVDAFVLGIFGWALLNFANIYYAIGLRARDLAVASARKKTSLAVSRTMAYHPEVQHSVAEMTLALDPVGPHIESIAQDWSDGVDHGAEWPAKIVSAKYHAVEAAKRVVDLAMDISGGAGMFKANELERLYRDVRCGGFHPANSALVHEIVGKTTLGIDLGEQPRWG